MEGDASELEGENVETEVDDSSETCIACSPESQEIAEALKSPEIVQEEAPSTATKEKVKFEPKLIAFCCNWCSYAGADLAGVSRLQYPSNIRIIRVMCSGRIEPQFVLRALELGADGVLVAGCHPGDCHYISGNLKAEARMKMLNKLLEILGIETRRVRLEWISASEGPKFAETIKKFVEDLKKLGPSPISIQDGE